MQVNRGTCITHMNSLVVNVPCWHCVIVSSKYLHCLPHLDNKPINNAHYIILNGIWIFLQGHNFISKQRKTRKMLGMQKPTISGCRHKHWYLNVGIDFQMLHGLDRIILECLWAQDKLYGPDEWCNWWEFNICLNP